jgi:DNA-binding response OmpR family regulator
MPHAGPVRLAEGPPLPGHRVQHSDAHHLLIIDETVVPCTPAEYALLLPLLDAVGTVVPLARLAAMTGQSPCTRQTRRTLTQRISRLRAKLWPFDLDICCLTGYGYLLLVTAQPDGKDT